MSSNTIEMISYFPDLWGFKIYPFSEKVEVKNPSIREKSEEMKISSVKLKAEEMKISSVREILDNRYFSSTFALTKKLISSDVDSNSRLMLSVRLMSLCFDTRLECFRMFKNSSVDHLPDSEFSWKNAYFWKKEKEMKCQLEQQIIAKEHEIATVSEISFKDYMDYCKQIKKLYYETSKTCSCKHSETDPDEIKQGRIMLCQKVQREIEKFEIPIDSGAGEAKICQKFKMPIVSGEEEAKTHQKFKIPNVAGEEAAKIH